MKQISMSFLRNYKKEFGGSLLAGKRKEKRPISTKSPMHLVLRSELKGVFNPGNRSLEKLIHQMARRFNVKIYDLALNWSHIHCVIRVRDRESYNSFIRVLSGTIALKIRKSKHAGTVFTLRPFTRILRWGRDFKNALSYQTLNQMEARGLLKRVKKIPKSGLGSGAELYGPKKQNGGYESPALSWFECGSDYFLGVRIT